MKIIIDAMGGDNAPLCVLQGVSQAAAEFGDGMELVLLEGFKDSGWPKIEVVRKEISDTPVSFQPLAVVGDIPGADFGLEDAQALADWLVAQMPGL